MDKEKKQSLLQIADQVSSIIREIIESEGEIKTVSNELDPSTDLVLAHSQKALAQKVDGYKYVIEQLEGQQKIWKKNADDAAKMAKAYAGYCARLEERLKLAMETLGTQELVGEKYKYVMQKASKPAVVIVNEEMVPDEYKKQPKVEYDKEKLLEDIKSGKDVHGVELVFSYYLKVKGVK